jgi:AraC-like DNA-binding protein
MDSRPRSVDRIGGWLRVRQTVVVPGVESGIDVLGSSWMLALIHVRGGTISYARGGGEVAIPWRRFAVFAPPGSILQARLDGCRLETQAIASDGPPPFLASAAEAWRVGPAARLPATPRELREMWSARAGAVTVGRDDVRSGVAWRTKRRLDRGFAAPITLESLCREMSASPAATSRAFSRAYGMPPGEYRRRLRLLAAVHQLTAGVPVVDALADAGFGDLSQTYRRFRSLLCATPGSYARSRTAKT